MGKTRIYKYDNVKALLIFLVVVGHLTTDYVGDAHCVRWITLWIYSFHMPAFVFVSGLMHKQYITEKQALDGMKGNLQLRWDKVLGFLFCAYGLKLFLQIFRTAIGQHPTWYWLKEPGIPWYLIVMAEYEIVLYFLRGIDTKKKRQIAVVGAFIVSAIIGYFPAVGDVLSLSRMINFLPIFLIGYYTDASKIIEISNKTWIKISSTAMIVISLVTCYLGPWTAYRLRKYFTGRRSYIFLEDFFPGTYSWAWLIRIGIWFVAIMLTLAIVFIIPDKKLGYISTIGERSLSIYFWHRPLCYWLCGTGLFPIMVKILGSDALALIAYILLGAVITAVFGMKIFVHPAKDLQKLGTAIIKKVKKES